jgi:carboxypeptidase Taq
MKELNEISREIALLHSTAGILSWDQETYMPKGGSAIRAEELALLSQLIHQRRTGKKFRTELGKLVDLETGEIRVDGLSRAERGALRAYHRDWSLATRLPEKFVREFALLTSESQQVWASARADNAFGRFAPYLERIVHLCRQKGEYLGAEDPYDALLDEHEPNLTRRKVETLFKPLKTPLQELIRRLPRPDSSFLQKRYAPSKQMAMSYELLEALGFDPHYSRLDLSAHPFCDATHPSDGRITSHILPNNPMYHLTAAIHEGGHLLYERNLPPSHYGSPLSEAASTAIHESQSRWWETLIGQSLPFWRHFYPRMQHHFKSQLADVSLTQFYKAINAIKSTPIRVDSDEVSYSLHIILRFELETALIDGTLEVRDLPDAWNSKMEELLYITPKNNAEGCLQDIHWSMGGFGYFPTYTLGNLYAAQLFATFEKEHPDWATKAAKGDFQEMRQWLKQQIHTHGRAYTPPELIKRVTGHALSPEAYTTYILEKYS